MENFEVFDNFQSLDDLIQVIYHSFNCFVLISEVGIASWDVELGLVDENKWWKGSWSKKDVIRQVEKPTTEKAIEHLVDKLANYIVAGELTIQKWSNSESKELRLMIGPEVVMDFQKLPDDESSTRALELLKKIALRAQLHGCRLFTESHSGPATISSKDNKPASSRKGEALEEQKHELDKAQKRIKELESQVSIVKEMIVAERETTKPVAPRLAPGTSRINPTKQKRKIVEAEFESD